MKLAPVSIEYDEETDKYRAVCVKCGYFSMWHRMAGTALAFASDHKKSRFHRTNSVPHRFGMTQK